MDKKKLQEDQVESIDEQQEGNDCSGVEELAKAWEAKYYRAIADYQNLEKRVRDDRGEMIRGSNKELLLKFLPILDTLLLAEKHGENGTLKVIVAQFESTLSSEGLTKIETVNHEYDPLTMEAVTTEKGKEGIVIQEVRTGYLLHDKLLRPAQVIVGNGEKEIK